MSKPISDFKIIKVDKANGCVVVADEDFGLEIIVPISGIHLSSAQIVGPYEIEFSFEDNTKTIVRFLE